MRCHRQFPVLAMCRILGVSRSGFYASSSKPASQRKQRHTQLIVKIKNSFEASEQNYGSPRVFKDLTATGEKVSRKTVAKLMKANAITPGKPRPFKPMTTDSNHPHPIAPNLLDRRFDQSAPDRAWVGDITYIPTDEGWLYLATVIDLCTRKVIGHAMADHLRASLPIDALDMALRQRQRNRRTNKESGHMTSAASDAAMDAPRADDIDLLYHSDRGVQYACVSHRALLAAHGITPSMSRTGNCYDNAVAESFFATLKRECVNRRHFAKRDDARAGIVQYIETFYNRTRRHSALGYLSPADFEKTLAA